MHGPLPAQDAAARRRRARGGTAPDRRLPRCRWTIRCSKSSGLRAALAWGGLELLTANDVAWRDAIAGAGVGVTGARAGIAATGTLLLPCGPGQPRGTHIIPPAHVCLVRAADLVATIEDAIVAPRSPSPHPSNMSWVSGPSRTADLEMRQTIGVHGPKSVDVIVISA